MMKRKFFFLIFLFFSVFSSYSLENFKIYLTPEAGILNGHIYESVWAENSQNILYQESLLDWEVSNIPFFGLSLDSDFFKYGYFHVMGRLGYPKLSGHMQDYDWLNSFAGLQNGIPYSWRDDPADELTNYSIHDNYLKAYFSINLSIGGNLFISNNFKISPFISYEYSYFNFDGENGYGIYKDRNWNQINFYSRVISYYQDYNSLFLGFNAEVELLSRIKLKNCFMISPAATEIYAIDKHYGTNDGTMYRDQVKNSLFIKDSIKMGVKCSRKISAGVSGEISWFPLNKGKNSTKSINKDGTPVSSTWILTTSLGGAETFLWSISGYISINL